MISGLGARIALALGSVCDRLNLRHPRLNLAVGDGEEQLFLAVEVRVHRPGRKPSLGRDLLDRRLVEPTAGKDTGRRGHELLASLLFGAPYG